MKALLGEYGKTIEYAIISILCIGIILLSASIITQINLFKFKSGTYNSNADIASGKPLVECPHDTIIVDTSFVDDLNNKGLDYLIDNNIVTINNAVDVKLSKIKISEEDGETYAYLIFGETPTLTVTAQNDKGVTKKTINVVYRNASTLY